MMLLRLNTSNQNKLREFERLFAQEGLTLQASNQDVKEIDGNPLEVVVHKASTLGEGILVEDTSLPITGANVGKDIRWKMDYAASLVGSQAEWVVLLACQQEDGMVYVYEGKVQGKIVPKRGEGFGFDPFFQPLKSDKTLAEYKGDDCSARALAVKHFVAGQHIWMQKPILTWEGAWQ